jgi:hypothetical protein
MSEEGIGRMSKSMVERVALAIYTTERLLPPDHGWSGADEPTKLSCRRKAHSAIEAMREPTGMVVRKGYSLYDPGGTLQPSPLRVWQAMIDEALTDPS